MTMLFLELSPSCGHILFNVLKNKENQVVGRFGIFFAPFLCYNSSYLIERSHSSDTHLWDEETGLNRA
jgi:hypothetical protein